MSPLVRFHVAALTALSLASVASARPVTHFQNCSVSTAATASVVLVPAAPGQGGVELNVGDEVGVFTADGLCAGAGVWEGESIAITVWADDPTTEPKEGFELGEALGIRVWESATGTEHSDPALVRVSFDEQYDADGLFANDAVFVLDQLELEPMTSVDAQVPVAFELAPNYPNPFRSSTTIKYGLPAAARVMISLYDVTGRRVRTLVDADHTPGWHTLALDAHNLASGTYFYRLQSDDSVAQRKLTVLNG